MTAFISIYILLGAVCVFSGLLSPETDFSVSKPVGSTAVLPCQLMSEETDTPYIKWQIKFKTELKTVFERAGEKTYQAEGYEGRVDVPEEKLRKGDCSLVLRNLRLTDTGVYTCYLAGRHAKRALSVTKEEISRVKLSVTVQTEERKPSDKVEETSGDKSGSSGNGGRNLQYWWLLVSLGLVLAGLVVVVVAVVWRLRRRNIYK